MKTVKYSTNKLQEFGWESLKINNKTQYNEATEWIFGSLRYGLNCVFFTKFMLKSSDHIWIEGF